MKQPQRWRHPQVANYRLLGDSESSRAFLFYLLMSPVVLSYLDKGVVTQCHVC